MNPESRADATLRCTMAGVAWLWCGRKCRLLADEVGLSWDMRRMMDGSLSAFRADLVGVRAEEGGRYRVDIVEVKGSPADARREDYRRGRSVSSGGWTRHGMGGGSKWWEGNLWEERPWNLWLLIDSSVSDEDIEGLPPGWGLIRVTDQSPRLVRKPQDGGNRRVSGETANSILYRLGTRVTGSSLPFMGGAMRDAVRRLEKACVDDDVDDPEPII